MRALGSFLALDGAPGVHHWPSALDVAYVGGAVRRSGRRFAHLDGARLVDAATFHDAIAEALDLPAYYGRNLDALAECLADCDGSHVLLWDDWGVLASREPRLVSIFLDLLGASRITTLLRGQAPTTD